MIRHDIDVDEAKALRGALKKIEDDLPLAAADKLALQDSLNIIEKIARYYDALDKDTLSQQLDLKLFEQVDKDALLDDLQRVWKESSSQKRFKETGSRGDPAQEKVIFETHGLNIDARTREEIAFALNAKSGPVDNGIANFWHYG